MARSKLIRRLGASSLVLTFCLAGPAFAQDPASDLWTVRSELNSLRQEEIDRRARIDALEQKLEALERAAGVGGQIALPDTATNLIRGRNLPTVTRGVYFGNEVMALAGQVPPPVQAAPPPSTDQAEPVRRAPAPSQAVQTVTQQEQGLFGDRLSFEVGTSYAHFDDARLNLSGFLALDAIFLGRIAVEESTGDVITDDATIRYRIGDRIQLDANVPYLFRHSNFQSGGAGGNAAGLAERSVTKYGLGDVSAGLSYRLLHERENLPDLVVSARVKAPTGRDPFGIEIDEVPGTEGNLAVPRDLPTGTGVWSGSLGVSALKTLDPMVLFANLTYFYAPDTGFDDIDESTGDQPGRVDLGEAIQYGAGVAFALNDRSSLSLSFTQRLVQRTSLKRDGGERRNVVGSQANVAAFNIGASFALTRRIALLATLGVGLTSDSPDMTLGFRIPFSF